MKYRLYNGTIVEAIEFQELIQIGVDSGATLNNGMPWSFDYNGVRVTHENDNLYLVGSEKFIRGDFLVTFEGKQPEAFGREKFLNTYRAIPVTTTTTAALPRGIGFLEAVDGMEKGKKATRFGWPDPNVFVWYMPEAVVKAEWCREPHLKALAEANGGEVTCEGAFRILTPLGAVMTGWFPSEADKAAGDWILLED